MLQMAVFLVGGVLHGTEAVVDRKYWQVFVWLFFSMTPDGVGLLQLPVAERHDDILILKSLAFVDGQDADALDILTMDGFLVVFLFPYLEKAVKVGSVVFQMFGNGIEEMTEIRTLTFGLVQTEQLANALREVGQGKGAEMVVIGSGGKACRQPLAESGSCILHVGGKEYLVIFESFVQDVVVPCLGKVGFAEQVVFVG